MKDSNLDSIIEKAIANEEEANQFYLKLAEIVTDKAAKDTLLYMAQEEKKHKEYLLQYRQESFIGNATNTSKIKKMLMKMAAQELKHKEKVEYLYANTAFVQTAGG